MWISVGINDSQVRGLNLFVHDGSGLLLMRKHIGGVTIRNAAVINDKVVINVVLISFLTRIFSPWSTPMARVIIFVVATAWAYQLFTRSTPYAAAR